MARESLNHPGLLGMFGARPTKMRSKRNRPNLSTRNKVRRANQNRMEANEERQEIEDRHWREWLKGKPLRARMRSERPVGSR